MEMETILTKEKADAMYEKIAKGLEKNKIVASAQMIDFAIREAWLRVLKRDANMRSANPLIGPAACMKLRRHQGNWRGQRLHHACKIVSSNSFILAGIPKAPACQASPDFLQKKRTLAGT
jgi:hypothetical protein